MISSKLLKKSFDLKKMSIHNGGATAGSTASASSHTQDGCTDTITETYNDEGKKTSLCISYICPDPV